MSKKLIAALLVCLSTTAVADESFAPFTGKVLGSKVRMRTEPSLDAHIVCETRAGQLFAVTGETGEYYAIQPKKGMKGYVFRTFVLDGVIEGDRVNVRLYPDLDAPVVGRLNRGDQVEAIVSDVNNKWLALDLVDHANFYIAKEYVDNLGPVEMIANLEQRHREATHLLSSAFLFAQSQIQRPFEHIDLDAIESKFGHLIETYADLPDIAERAQEATNVMQEIFVQKKLAFLESKSHSSVVSSEIDASHLDRLADLGIEIKPNFEEKEVEVIAEAATVTMGLTTPLSDEQITDKMLVWQPLEESLFHLWAAANGERTMDEFYNQESLNATILSGIVEPYNRPVKNRPGDFVLRSDNLPVAFLYSTKVNLDHLVGKKVTIMASPRPNNNFAFPAYYVLSTQ